MHFEWGSSLRNEKWYKSFLFINQVTKMIDHYAKIIEYFITDEILTLYYNKSSSFCTKSVWTNFRRVRNMYYVHRLLESFWRSWPSDSFQKFSGVSCAWLFLSWTWLLLSCAWLLLTLLTKYLSDQTQHVVVNGINHLL